MMNPELRASVAQFVKTTIDRRSVSFVQNRSARGISTRISMANATTANTVVQQIQERQRIQDQTLSRLHMSRQFRRAERSQRPENTPVSSYVRASMNVNLRPVITNPYADPEVDTEENNRLKTYKKHGLYGVRGGCFSSLDHGCGRILDVIDYVPLDFKVVISTIVLGLIGASVLFLFTVDYSVDATSLE